MRRVLLSLLVALATLVFTASSGLAQAGPEFKLGFQTLAQLIPQVVGQPVDNERFDPDTGNSIQRTTTGMMVWRKATNTAAFTDGSTTWLIGPHGLQVRPNDMRFDWEGAGGTGTSALPSDAVSADFSPGPNGVWTASFTVHNPLDQPVHVEINAVALESPGGPSIMDAPTVFVQALPPGGSRTATVRVPVEANVGDWRWWAFSRSASDVLDASVDVGTSKPLRIDAVLVGAMEELKRVDGGDWLVRVAAENGVRIGSGSNPLQHPRCLQSRAELGRHLLSAE